MYRFKLWHEQAGEYEMKHAPVGWDDMKFNIKREEKLHGIKMDFTLDLEFVKDGYDYIHSVYETFGIQANVLIFVYEANRIGFHYDLVYTGVIAYEKWKSFDFPRKGTANIDFVGFTHKFLNSEDVQVNLHSTKGIHGKPMGPLPTVGVNMHSQAINQTYYGLKEVSSTDTGFFIDDATRLQKFTFGFDKVEPNEIQAFTSGGGWIGMEMDNPLFESKVSASFTFDISLQGRLYADDKRDTFDDIDIKIILQKNTDAPIVLHSYQNSDTDGSDTSMYNVRRTVTIDTIPGDKIYLHGTCQISDISVLGKYEFHVEHTMDKGSFLRINGNTTTGSTDGNGVMVYEAFDRICESITGYAGSFYSEFFGRTDSKPFQYPKDGPGSLIMIVNGFALRGFPQVYDPGETDDARIKRYIFSSFKELYQAMDAIFCLGVGIEKVNGVDVVRVEPRSHFYRSGEVSAMLGKASKLSKAVASEFYYKEVNVGYKEWKIEDVNGLKEFNAMQHWTTPITKVKNKYEAVCNFIASGFRIEQARRDRYTETETTDSRDDDNNFIITLVRDGYGFKTATNGGMSDIKNIDNPNNSYNLSITPMNMLRRHLSQLASSFYKVTGPLYFNKGEGNYKVSYVDFEGNLIENGVDVAREAIGDAYFIPEHYEFTATVNQFQAKTIRENPYSLIKFMDSSGAELSGYLVSLEYDAREKTGEFKLLRVQ